MQPAGAVTESPEACRASNGVPSAPTSSTELPVCEPLTLLKLFPSLDVARPMRVWKLPLASIVLPEYQALNGVPAPGSGRTSGELRFE